LFYVNISTKVLGKECHHRVVQYGVIWPDMA
jgi:hypothetical protein